MNRYKMDALKRCIKACIKDYLSSIAPPGATAGNVNVFSDNDFESKYLQFVIEINNYKFGIRFPPDAQPEDIVKKTKQELILKISEIIGVKKLENRKNCISYQELKGIE